MGAPAEEEEDEEATEREEVEKKGERERRVPKVAEIWGRLDVVEGEGEEDRGGRVLKFRM